MSVRIEMLQVARLASRVLGDSAECVRAFAATQQNPDGGFKDRTGASDLYYTVFGAACMAALDAPMPRRKIADYLVTFDSGIDLNLVHLCSLARCWASVLAPQRVSPTETEWSDAGLSLAWRRRVADGIEGFRSADGGYHSRSGEAHGTAYGAFLAHAAYQDLGLEMPGALRVVSALKFLEQEKGGWANERHTRSGSTNATAAAVTFLRHTNMPISGDVGRWLLERAHPQGGFVAGPGVPLPDLLSTATALHALGGLEAPLQSIHEACLDFIDSLWTNEGSFYAHWHEDRLDIEYTFYGLLALGHLSLKG